MKLMDILEKANVEKKLNSLKVNMNMAKTSAMVAMKTISMQQLFKKTNVIGLLMDYDSNCVVKVIKMSSDYIAGTTELLEADSSENIDRMLARINAQFKCTSSD